MNVQRITLACAVALAVAGPAFADDTMTMPMSGAKSFPIMAQNSSGETGTVQLAPASDGKATTVTIALKGAPAAAQPAHIHTGTCAKLDPTPKYPLKSVTDGKSVTTVDVPMSKLTAGGFAVNVHKSTSDIATYVACGNLAMTSGGAMMKPMASASP